MLCHDLEGWHGREHEGEGGSGGKGGIHTIMTDSRCCMTESNTKLQSTFIPIKRKKIN